MKSLTQYNARLEEVEAEFRDAMAEAYEAMLYDMERVELPTHPNARVPRRHAARLARDIEELSVPGPSGSVMTFDEVHRLTEAQALFYDYAVIQARYAQEVGDALLELMEANVRWLWSHLSRGKALTQAVLDTVLYDEVYPVRDTLLSSLMRVARSASGVAMRGVTQGKPAKESVDLAMEHARKQSARSVDAVMHYEDTRLGSACVYELYPQGRFRTVCVKDGRACHVCLDIEADQRNHPVPVADMVPGVNAPPFHPFCRCTVEVV